MKVPLARFKKIDGEEGVFVKVTFPALLSLVFLFLKLAGHIDWSWWWVFAPFWVPIALLVVAFVVCSIALGVVGLIEKLSS